MPKAKPELKIVVSNDPPEFPPVEAAPEQVEMPFAVVNGEPLTQMPRDLYIPPQALEVFLEAFEGPLDLLLYLIRRQNLDILDIPLAEITRQYMEYIELMEGMQFELAGEYMVMAATLAEIKSTPLASNSAAASVNDPPRMRAAMSKGPTTTEAKWPRREKTATKTKNSRAAFAVCRKSGTGQRHFQPARNS